MAPLDVAKLSAQTAGARPNTQRRKLNQLIALCPVLIGANTANSFNSINNKLSVQPQLNMGYSKKLNVTEISFWTMQLAPFHNDYIHGVIRDFEAVTPGARVKWVDIPWAEAERKTLASMAAGTAPDVVNLNPQFSSKLAEFDALHDPRTYLSPSEIAAYVPAAWDANQLRGHAFALPWYLTSNITLYNKDLLGRAQTEVPRDWNSLLDASRKIRRVTGDYAFFPPLDGSAPLEVMVTVNGKLLSPDGCAPDFINATGASVLQSYVSLFREGLIPRNILTEGHRSAVRQFLAGQVAMISTGMQFLTQVQKANPAVYADTGIAGQIGSTQSAPNIAAMNVSVPKLSKHPELAFRFAAFLTNAKNQLDFAKRVAILPSSLESLDASFFRTPTGDAVLDDARRISVEQTRRGVVQIPPLPNYNKLRVNYLRNLQSVMLEKSTVPDALKDVDQTWRTLLGCRA
jgi:putative chitobiose transport system substrate-binding protein